MRNLLFLCCIILFSSCQEKEHKIPGSFKALQHFSKQRAYPNNSIPQGSFSQAFEEHEKITSVHQTMLTPSELWEAEGPWNVTGRTLCLAINPQDDNILYAGSASGGLWRSNDLGNDVSWQRMETGFPVLGVSTIAFAPGDSMVMYIGTGEVYNYYDTGTDAAYRSTRGSYGIGILKSEDGGSTWKKSLDWSYNEEHGIWMIKVHPTNPDIIFANTTEGVYRSKDAGETWDLVLPVIMGTDIEINESNPDLLLASFGNFNTEGKGIYRSEDGGDSWLKIEGVFINSFNGKILMAQANSNPDRVYASIGNGFSFEHGATWLYRSNDFGLNWVLANQTDYSLWQGWFSHDVAVNPNNPDEAICVGIETWKTENSGDFIEHKAFGGVTLGTPPIEGPDGPPDYVHSDQHFVMYHPNIEDLVLIACDGGVYKSLDGGDSWSSANGGMQTAQFYNGFSVSHNGNDLSMGGLQDNSTVIYKGSKAWTRAIGGDGSWTAINYDNENIIFGSWQGLNVMRSEDQGGDFIYNNFKEADDNPLFISPYAVCDQSADIMMAAGLYVYYSVNSGISWVTLNGSEVLDQSGGALCLAIAPSDCGTAYIGTAPFNAKPKIFATYGDLDTWVDVSESLPDRFPNDLAVDPIDPMIVYATFSGFGTGHVFRSEDGGENWVDISYNLPDLPTNAIIMDPRYPDRLYVGNDFGVYSMDYSSDTEWSKWVEGMPLAAICMDLKVDPINNQLWVATHGNGAYSRDLIEVPSSTIESNSLSNFEVYPNPVSNYIRIKSSKELIETIRIIDDSGRKLKNENSINALTKELNISSLANGVYTMIINEKESKRIVKVSNER